MWNIIVRLFLRCADFISYIQPKTINLWTFDLLMLIILLLPFHNSIDKLIISDPVDYHGRSFMAHLNQLPWTEPLFTRRVEQTVETGKHMTFCRVSNESISVVSVMQKKNRFSTHNFIILNFKSFVPSSNHSIKKSDIYFHCDFFCFFLFVSITGGWNHSISKFYGIS